MVPALFLLGEVFGVNGIWATVPVCEGLTLLLSVLLPVSYTHLSMKIETIGIPSRRTSR